MNSLLSTVTAPIDTRTLFDTVVKRAGATIQHGSNNDRVYLMGLGNANPNEVLSEIHHLADQYGYGKIFAKIPHTQAQPFLRQGYRIEARIPRFYDDADALFLGYYPDPERALLRQPKSLHHTLEQATMSLRPNEHTRTDPAIRPMKRDDTEAMAKLYGQVFPSYPFPITEAGFIRETMEENVAYFGVEKKGRLVALASAEKDQASGTVEMTDFATVPDVRGEGWAQRLLAQMEHEMANEGYRMAFTIARAVSVGMNRTFAQRQYRMAGRLVNNTQISGNIESMNVWYKQLI